MNMNPNNNEANNRTAITGEVKNERETMLQVQLASGDLKWVPKTCIAAQHEVGEGDLFFLQDAKMGEATVDVSVYGELTTDDAEVRDLADAWVEFGDLPGAEAETEDVQLKTLAFDDDDDDEDEAEAPAAMKTLAFDEDDDFDDSVPQFSGQSVDLADIEADEDKVAKAKKSAAQKMAALKDSRYADAKEVTKDMNSDISKAMASGKRHADLGPWDFRTNTVELVARVVDPTTGEVLHYPVTDGKGDARIRIITNPTLATPNNPLGPLLNRSIGPNYATMEHPDLFLPVINAVEQLDGVTWDAFSFNDGARALLNVDMTGYATKSRRESKQGLPNYINLGANALNHALTEEFGGHRMGISLMNSHDGKSAVQGFASVMRVYCQNLAMRGGVEALMMTSDRTKVRHMQGAMADFDPELLAQRIAASMMDVQKHLALMHVLRHVPIEAGLFDKVMTVFGSHGLVAQPTVKVKAGDLNSLQQDKQGNLILQAGDLHKEAVKIGGGHAYNAVMSGWMDSQVDYVALKGKDKEAEGTLFHAAQCVTGTITHNPIWSDGKRILHGKSQGVDTLIKRSSKATDMLESIAINAINAFSEYNDNQPVDDLSSMVSFFAEKPEALIVPYSKKANGKKHGVSLTNLPDYQETWDVTVVAEAKAD